MQKETQNLQKQITLSNQVTNDNLRELATENQKTNEQILSLQKQMNINFENLTRQININFEKFAIENGRINRRVQDL